MSKAAKPAWEAMPESARRRVAAHAVLRSILTALLIVVAYFSLPMTTSLAWDGLLTLIVGLGLLATLLVWQIREILVSHYPAARAVGALVVSVPLFLVTFATIYYVLADSQPGTWSEPLTRLDAAYYAVTVFATVGFGDVTAVSQTARAVTTLQMLSGLVLAGVIARVIVAAVQESRRRQGMGGP